MALLTKLWFKARSNWVELLIFLVALVIFTYFRLSPIINQTVPYTYDQGRDFQKAADIINNRHLTLLGPTSGINGIFHGVWWYYFLIIPFLLSNGNPIGYSFFIFFLSLLQFFLLYAFLKKEFNLSTGLFTSSLIIGSSYFILMSFFVISSVQLLPFLLLFFYFSYQFFKTKRFFFQLLIFLCLGFLFESELPFFFIIPSFFIAILIIGNLKKFFPDKKSVAYSLMSLFIPIIPRVLFELSHNFLQSRAVINFFINPKFHTPKPLEHVFYDRLRLFWDYYLVLFPQNNQFIAICISAILLFSLAVSYKKLEKLKQTYLFFISSMLLLMFLFSLFYKDTFWPNYYEGLPYFYIIILAFGFYLLPKQKHIAGKIISFILILFFFISSFGKLLGDIRSSKISSDGLRAQTQVLDHLYGQNGNKTKSFCLRIYTPPVIPYTYNYLFYYYSRTKKYTSPTVDFIENRCWYIFEKEPYQFRVDRWRTENIPEKSRLIDNAKFENGTTLELWEKPK